MKHHLSKPLLVFLLLAPVAVFSQKIEVKYGPEQIYDKQRPYSFLGNIEAKYAEDDEFIYCRKNIGNSKTIFIEKIKKSNGKSVWEKQLPANAYGKNTYFCGLRRTEIGFLMFVKKEDSKLKQSYLTAQKLDEEFNLVGEEMIVETSKKHDKGQNIYGFKVSKLGNKYLITGDYVIWKEKNINEQFGFTLLDSNLNIIWQKGFDLPKDREYNVWRYDIDSIGNLTALFQVNVDSKKRNQIEKDYEYMVYKYTPSNNTIQSAVIDLSSKMKFYTDEWVTLNVEKNEVNMRGFYSNQAKMNGSEGCFSTRFDIGKMEIDQINLIPFTKEMLVKYLGAKDAAKGKLPSDLVIRYIVRHDNGTLSYVLEQNWKVTTTAAPGESTTFDRITYFYEDVLIITVGKDGKLDWFSYFPKSQSGSNTTYFSIYAFSEGNKLIVLFNAVEESVIDPAKYEGYITTLYDKKNNNVLVAMSFSDSGEMTTKTFTPGSDKKMFFNLNSIKRLGNGKYALSCERLGGEGRLNASLDATMEVW